MRFGYSRAARSTTFISSTTCGISSWKSFTGPDRTGKYTIFAKDALKFADGDRAQAPLPSNGFLSAGINADDLLITLLPAGVGDEYPDSGYVNIGGKEIAG